MEVVDIWVPQYEGKPSVSSSHFHVTRFSSAIQHPKYNINSRRIHPTSMPDQTLKYDMSRRSVFAISA
jgi:hypothetical protein